MRNAYILVTKINDTRYLRNFSSAVSPIDLSFLPKDARFDYLTYPGLPNLLIWPGVS